MHVMTTNLREGLDYLFGRSRDRNRRVVWIYSLQDLSRGPLSFVQDEEFDVPGMAIINLIDDNMRSLLLVISI